MGALLRAGGVLLVAGFLFRMLNKSVEMAEAETPYPDIRPDIRDAGPDNQEGIDAADWDVVDEQADESFPASDPPGNYMGLPEKVG